MGKIMAKESESFLSRLDENEARYSQIEEQMNDAAIASDPNKIIPLIFTICFIFIGVDWDRASPRGENPP